MSYRYDASLPECGGTADSATDGIIVDDVITVDENSTDVIIIDDNSTDVIVDNNSTDVIVDDNSTNVVVVDDNSTVSGEDQATADSSAIYPKTTIHFTEAGEVFSCTQYEPGEDAHILCHVPNFPSP